MRNAIRNLPTSDDDKYNLFAGNKVSTSSAASDLAHISQTSPRASFATRTLETRNKSSEWPQFAGSGRVPAHDGCQEHRD
ncbi:RNA-binding protein [Mycena sanguinolenta]|uniref:RNA-binding protein n=1 Tax=Mycena sanguinolenta TaxID=230812 RepID=A0A8H6XMQ5_9AGAR|nr:RNA-binding protein [Mycena sanguinolenta]